MCWEAELRQPAELQQFGERERSTRIFAFRGRLSLLIAGGMPLQPACLADRHRPTVPKSRHDTDRSEPFFQRFLPETALNALRGFFATPLLGNGLPLEFRSAPPNAPGDLARGFSTMALETAPSSKILILRDDQPGDGTSANTGHPV